MRTRALLALAVALAFALGSAVGEWVQVAVIDRDPDGSKKQQQQAEPLGPAVKTTTSSTLPPPPPPPTPTDLDQVGAPGPSVDDVITIRRTVGDSFSNKEAVVPAPGVGTAAAPHEGEEVVQDGQDGQDGQDAYTAVPGPDADGFPLPELREAHQALLKQSTAPVSGKLDFLRRLKNRLLRHIASLAPLSALSLAGAAGRTDGVAAEDRAGRGHKGLGFPSNEGTLMSLAFLVFAVFLVKVVMQLIYAVQNSQANNNAGVRVAQMQIPDPVMPGAVGSMMGTMMNMVPAMMPPMMAAMNNGMGMGMRGSTTGRNRRMADGVPDVPQDRADVDRMTTRVLEAIDKARARLAELQLAVPSV